MQKDKEKIQKAEAEIRTLMTNYSTELEMLLEKKREIMKKIIQNAENKKIKSLRDKIDKPTHF